MEKGKTYETINGINYLILWRKKGKELTDVCSFCHEHHLHSLNEGHRAAHCSNEDLRGIFEFVAPDGTVLEVRNGYIIKEY